MAKEKSSLSHKKILQDLKAKKYQPIYWLDGEETYFIDEIIEFAENYILQDTEKDFNLTILYGKEIDAGQVVSVCQQIPMFGDKKVVIVKEAQNLKKIDQLTNYISNPSKQTLLFIAHPEKSVDSRTKFGKFVKENTVYFNAKKISIEFLPNWIVDFLEEKKMRIEEKAIKLLIEHIGADLQKMMNELNKIIINKTAENNLITLDDIENYVGISKAYNIYELQSAIVERNLSKAFQIVQYLAKNPKITLTNTISNLYTLFSRAYAIAQLKGMNEYQMAQAMGLNNTFFIKEPIQLFRNFGVQKIEESILILHQYNSKAVGINSASYTEGELMQEMVRKLIL